LSPTNNLKEKVKEGSMSVTRWCIEHPHTVISFYLGLFILAVLAIGFYLPQRMMPYVESPMVGVVSMMPGLSAREMEIHVSKPIEEQMVNVKNLRFIRSISQDGFSIVTLEFNYGTDMKKSLFDVQALMNVVQASLPATGANLKPSWVVAIDPLNVPVLSLSLTGKGWDNLQLREFADNEVINRLKTLPGVYSVVPFGGYKRQLQVIVNRQKMAAYGVSILDVRKAVDSYNISASAGTITHKGKESIIRVDTLARRPQDLLNVPILSAAPAQGAKPSPPRGDSGGMAPGMGGGVPSESSPRGIPGEAAGKNPSTVYLRDMARVEDTHWERRSAYHFVHDGQIVPSIQVSVLQNPEASSAKVIPLVMKELRNIEEENPGVKFQVAYDNSTFVNILFRNMFDELFLAILLTGLTILFFLGDWRGAVISLITIPMSLAMAILALAPLGMSLNSGTLVGLLISIGRLVDDSIVCIHSVGRHLKMGKPPKVATIDGINEVMLPVLASTFVTIIALVPLLFTGGIVELMFRELVIPLIVALLASTFVALTLTGLLTSTFLKTPGEMEKERRSILYRLTLGPLQKILGWVEKIYAGIIDWSLRHRFINLSRAVIIIIIGAGFYYFIGSEMMPLADVGQGYGILETMPGTSFEDTEKIVFQVEKLFLKHPEIERVSTEIGAETMLESFSPYYTGYAMNQANGATFMITLSDKEKRKKTIWQVIDSIQKEAMETIPGIRRFQIKEMGSDVMATSAAPVALLIFGKDFHLLDRIGDQVLEIAKDTPGFYQGATQWGMEMPTYELDIDLARARETGLTPASIALQAYYAFRGGLAGEYYRVPNIRQGTVLIRYEGEDRKNLKDLEEMYITTPGGKQVPLKTVASVRETRSPAVIERDGQRRVKSVLGYYRPGDAPSMDVSMEVLMRAASRVNFPPGYGIEMRGDMTQMADSFRRLLIGLLLAFFFMYLVLVAQFRGFVQPLQMIFSLPQDLAGVFICLWILHQNFSTVSVLAVIILFGMDITTAILIIDKIMDNRDRGMPRREAVIKAAVQRLRPILMTSITTIIVMVPLSIFPKTGMDAYSPMGTVIMGGLLMGTFQSLFDIPVINTYVDDAGRGVYKTLLGREFLWPVTKPPEDEAQE
jgi:HAE1 family hydrophobic/amphiphilic exporter-1